MARFGNKTALIVGGTSGIGAALAEELLSSGAVVHIVGRNIDKVSEQANLTKHKVNITDSTEVDALIESIGQLGSLDYLVNASGIFGPKSFLEHTRED